MSAEPPDPAADLPGPPPGEAFAAEPAAGPDPAEPEAAPPAPRRRRGFGQIVVIALVAIAAAASSPWWLPVVAPHFGAGQPIVATTAPEPSPPPAAPGAADPARLDALEHELAALRTQLAGTASASALDALSSRVEALGRPAAAPNPAGTEQLAALSTALDQLKAQVSGLTDRVAALAAQGAERQADFRAERALALAAGEIEQALASGGPFTAPLAVLQAAPSDPDLAAPLAVLARHAASGVASRWALGEQLTALPAQLDRPAPPPAAASFWQRVEARLGGLVTIRRLDQGSAAPGQPPSPDHAVAVAEAALKAGDLGAAIRAMDGLHGAAAATAQPWLAAAKARLETEQAVAALLAAATRRLAAGTAP